MQTEAAARPSIRRYCVLALLTVIYALNFLDMTVFCGMAQSVATLALARIGVGESGGTPASQPIIADLFNKNERPRALGVYAIGTYLGVFLGCFIGGYINQHDGWRMAFYVAGLPGLALAAVLWLTQAVRYSLLSAAVTTTLGALLFIWAARSIRADIQRAS